MRKLLLRILTATSGLVLGLGVVLLVRAWQVGQRAERPGQLEPLTITLEVEALTQRLAGALRFPTVSFQDPTRIDSGAFRALHAYLEAQFPWVHTYLRREVISGLSLLYTWPGQDTTLPAVLFMGHQDVVPVATQEAWTHPPFGGIVADGYVWGRGALDDKISVLGVLEAVEQLLADGFRPVRTIYLAFGHDEEVGGRHGARRIAELLAARGVRLITVVDEGGFVVDGVIPGVTRPVALIGVAEKGYLSLELIAMAPGGHSSTPPHQTAIGTLSQAIVTLEAHPFPARLDGPTRGLLERLAPYAPIGSRVVLANLWLFGPLMKHLLAQSPAGNASLRTTIAPTIFEGGVKENVLPTRARAVVNFRIYPGETVASVEQRVRLLLQDLPVQVQRLEGTSTNPSPVSDFEGEAFRRMVAAIQQAWAEAPPIVAPYLVPGATDARYFTGLSSNVYRFIGARITPELLATLHGVDERIPVEEYVKAVRTYYALLRTLSGP
ncbi:MAG: M20 family peptidase [Rhodothermus sp.]|nr:M20 family peptidase [Rhodothermus sp.]